jgi:hypothetical protein
MILLDSEYIYAYFCHFNAYLLAFSELYEIMLISLRKSLRLCSAVNISFKIMASLSLPLSIMLFKKAF